MGHWVASRCSWVVGRGSWVVARVGQAKSARCLPVTSSAYPGEPCKCRDTASKGCHHRLFIAGQHVLSIDAQYSFLVRTILLHDAAHAPQNAPALGSDWGDRSVVDEYRPTSFPALFRLQREAHQRRQDKILNNHPPAQSCLRPENPCRWYQKPREESHGDSHRYHACREHDYRTRRNRRENRIRSPANGVCHQLPGYPGSSFDGPPRTACRTGDVKDLQHPHDPPVTTPQPKAKGELMQKSGAVATSALIS